MEPPDFGRSVNAREDKTIETAVPLPAPFAGGSSGATPFTPCHFFDATPPECPRSQAKVSPRPLPWKTGLKGGVPFSPLDLISQFVPVPLPFSINHFFPGSPETIDSFFATQWVQIISELAFSYLILAFS